MYGGPHLHALVQGIIEPDGDGDGYGDESQDPCPAVSGRVCHSPQPTPPPPPPEEAPPPSPPSSTVTAAFSVTPKPPCTNAFVDLDGSASTTTAEGGIVSYEWFFNHDNRGAFIPSLQWAAIDNSGRRQDPIVSAQPRARVSFGYNWFDDVIDRWMRDDVLVTLVATDARGNSARAHTYLEFVAAKFDPSTGVTQAAREYCARAQHVVSVRPSTTSQVTSSGSVASLAITNPAPTQSLGTVTLSRMTTRAGRLASASAVRAKKLGSGEFAIPAGQRAEVRVPLTPAGRRLVRKRRRVKVRVVVVTVASGGDKATTKRTLTLTR